MYLLFKDLKFCKIVSVNNFIEILILKTKYFNFYKMVKEMFRVFRITVILAVINCVYKIIEFKLHAILNEENKIAGYTSPHGIFSAPRRR